MGLPWNAATIALTLAALAERDSWSLRVRRQIPRNVLFRAIAFLFYSGSAGVFYVGVALCGHNVDTILVQKYLLTGTGPDTAKPAHLLWLHLVLLLTIAALRHNVFRNFSTKAIAILAACFGMTLFLLPYVAMILRRATETCQSGGY